MTNLPAATWTRLEPGQPTPRDLGNNRCRTDCPDWGRFFSRGTFALPVSIDLHVRLIKMHAHPDARPYDGISLLWGTTSRPNDRNYSLNLLKRDPAGAHPTVWQEEVQAVDPPYRKLGSPGPATHWSPGEWHLFQFLILGNGEVEARANGQRWAGHDTDGTILTPGRIGIRADRCAAEWSVSVRPGATRLHERAAGPDRWSTAAAISRRRFLGGAPVVYLASGMDWPDAVAGAGLDDGPTLLIERQALPEATRIELRRLRPLRIIHLGGPGAISDEVADAAADAAGL